MDFKHYQTYGTVCQFSSSVLCHQQSKKTINPSSLSRVPQFRQTLKLNETLCDSLQSYPSIYQSDSSDRGHRLLNDNSVLTELHC